MKASLLSRRGFTLTEVLVVVVVVAILIAIIIPVVGSARKSAKRAGCLSNLRQLMVAARLYASDHKGNFPIVPDSSRGLSASFDKDPATSGLVTALLPYADGGAKIFYCTDAQGNYSYENQASRSDKNKPYWTIGYYWLPADGPFAKPSTLPQTIHGDPRCVLATCIDFNNATPHDGRINLAYADGHVSEAPKSGHVWDLVNFSTLRLK